MVSEPKPEPEPFSVDPQSISVSRLPVDRNLSFSLPLSLAFSLSLCVVLVPYCADADGYVVVSPDLSLGRVEANSVGHGRMHPHPSSPHLLRLPLSDTTLSCGDS